MVHRLGQTQNQISNIFFFNNLQQGLLNMLFSKSTFMLSMFRINTINVTAAFLKQHETTVNLFIKNIFSRIIQRFLTVLKTLSQT